MADKLKIDELRKIENLDTIKILTDPRRLEILRLIEFANKGGNLITVKKIAGKLNLPASKLYYHINLMEKHELISVADTQIVSGIIEKHYQVTAFQFVVDNLSLGSVVGSDDEKLRSLLESVSTFIESINQDIYKSLRTITRLVRIEKEGGEPAPEQTNFHLSKEEMFLTSEQASELRDRIVVIQEEYQDLEQENLKQETDSLHYSFSIILNPNYHLTYTEEELEMEDE